MSLRDSRIAQLSIIIIIIWIILAIFFGIFDLNISIAVVDQNSLWGNFGADYGEAPGWGLIFIALAVVIGSVFRNVKKQKIGGILMIIIGMLYLIYAVIEDNRKDIYEGIGMVISVVAFTILTFNKDWRKFFAISAVITLLAIINVLLIVQIIKILWGRVRFRDLLPDYSNFTPWYIPLGPTGDKSFTSGHAAMGCMFLPLLILVKDREWKEPVRILATVLLIGWALFVGLSRIVVGAHYASDVLFSTGFAAIITIVLYITLYKNKEKISEKLIQRFKQNKKE